MFASVRSLTLTILLLTSFQDKLIAQKITSPSARYLVLAGGYSGSSIRFLGKTTGAISRYSYIGMIRPTRFSWRGNQMMYSFGIYPLISFSYPRRDFNEQMGLAYGGGISPLGFHIQHELSSSLAVAFTARSGIIYLNRFFPTEQGRRLNYSFDLSTTLQWQLTPLYSLAAGYTFHHISNAQTGRENPGLDSNFFSLTLLIQPKKWQ